MMEADGGMGGLGSEIMKLGVRDKKSITFSGQVVDIQAERNRQNELRDSGKFNHTCADPGVGSDLEDDVLIDMMANLAILVEEVGEYAVEINELAQFEHWLARNTRMVFVPPMPPYDSMYRELVPGVVPKAKWEYAGPHEETEAWIARVRGNYLAKMRTELVQVAAVTLGMIERLDLEG